MRNALVLVGCLAGAAALRGCRRANVYSLRATERTALRRSSGREDGSAAGMAGAAWVPAAWTVSDWRLWEDELVSHRLWQGKTWPSPDGAGSGHVGGPAGPPGRGRRGGHADPHTRRSRAKR